MKEKSYISEFVGLDLLRFLLSITVVLCHYYHFFYQVGPTRVDTDVIPTTFGPVVALLFKHGGNATRVFWIISGFIFFTIYVKPIESLRVGFKEFSILRFSRLYPLHLLTFIMVFALEGLYFQSNHTFLWLQTIDVKHFILQIFLLGAWYPSFEHSFNVPIWSVSIEIFVYAVFFGLARIGALKNDGLYVVFAMTSMFAAVDILNPFGPCLAFFFAGCILSRVVQTSKSLFKLMVQLGIASTVLLVGLVLYKFYYTAATEFAVSFGIEIIFFPLGSLIVVAFIWAFRGLTNGSIIKSFKGLGDLTYSTYLIHYPIQMMIIVILKPKDISLFDRPLVLVFFMCIVVASGYMLFRFLEKPVQNLIRKKLLSAEDVNAADKSAMSLSPTHSPS